MIFGGRRLSEIAAKARVALGRLVNRLLLGPVVGRMPRSCRRSLEEVQYLEPFRRHIVSLTKTHDPVVVRYGFPGDYPPHFRRDKAFERRYVYLLQDVFVSPNSGLAWLPEGYVLQESVGSLFRIMSWGGVLHEPLVTSKALPSPEPILACPSTGYFHWLFEILPNTLRALDLFPNAKILVPKKSPSYLRGALELLAQAKGGRRTDGIVSSSAPLRVEKLIMPQMEGYSGFVNPTDIEKLSAVLKSQAATSEKTSSRVYVSRARAKKRTLANEAELESRLRALGFAIVCCESLAFRDQISLFSNARLIVGPHGAGLSNMVWADPPCRVLEIFPWQLLNDCYARLAVSLGFEYSYIACDRDGSSSGAISVAGVLDKVAAATERAGLE